MGKLLCRFHRGFNFYKFVRGGITSKNAAAETIWNIMRPYQCLLSPIIAILWWKRVFFVCFCLCLSQLKWVCFQNPSDAFEKHGKAMTLYAWSHFGWKLESQNEATTNHRLNDCWHQESKIVLFFLKHLMWKVMKRLWKGCQKVKLLEVLMIQVFKLIGQNHICIISLQICSLFPSFKQRTTDISQTLSQRHGWHGWHGYITWQSEDGATRSL